MWGCGVWGCDPWSCGVWECSFLGSGSKGPVTPQSNPPQVGRVIVLCGVPVVCNPPPHKGPPNPSRRPQMVWRNNDACPLVCFAL